MSFGAEKWNHRILQQQKKNDEAQAKTGFQQ
jgi:hypothetical protein